MYDYRTYRRRYSVSTLDDDLKNALSEFWDERAIPSDSSTAASIDDFVDSLESITAVDVLLTMDKIIGEKIPTCVIKPGGYKSKDEFVNLLSNAVLEWHTKL